MTHIYLNKTHPGLYKAVMGIAFVHLFIGLAILNNAVRGYAIRTWLAYIFVALFIAIFFCLIYGVFRPRYQWVRFGLIAGLAVTVFLALIFVFSLPQILSGEMTRKLAFLFPPWFGFAWWQYTCLAEPPRNPDNEKKNGVVTE